jgi:hypothetical protein
MFPIENNTIIQDYSFFIKMFSELKTREKTT